MVRRGALGGRYPNQARCRRAWLLPLLIVVALDQGLFRLPATEGVDVRPGVVSVVFVVVLICSVVADGLVVASCASSPLQAANSVTTSAATRTGERMRRR